MTDQNSTQNTAGDKSWPELEASENRVEMTETERKEMGRKNLVVGGALVAFVVLVFLVTMAKMGANFGAS